MNAVLSLARPQTSTLDELAHEINVRLLKADDHRLSASLKLAEAKVACKEAGVSFKEWVLSEIKLGYFEATRLAKIGSSDDPAKALADHREKTRARKSQAIENSQQKVALRSATLPLASPESPRPARGKDAICVRVRAAVTALSGLPPAHEVASYFRGTDAAMIVSEHLPVALRWLQELNDAWRSDDADGSRP